MLLVPLFVAGIFLVVQFALYFWARDIAIAAARAGARVARAEADASPRWPNRATTAAQARIDQLGPRLLTDVQVTAITPAANVVGVRVSADVPAVLPDLLVPRIVVVSAGDRERFVPDE